MTKTSGPAKPGLYMEEMAARAGDATRLLKALANEKRLMILCMLVDGERSVGEIGERFDLSQSALSQHLAVLRRDKLVETRRMSQTIYYRLADAAAQEVIRVLHDLYCSGGSGRLQKPQRNRAKS